MSRLNYRTTRGAIIAARKERKRVLILNSSIQAKAAKAMSIIALKGSNGMSMDAAALKAHGLNPKERSEA